MVSTVDNPLDADRRLARIRQQEGPAEAVLYEGEPNRMMAWSGDKQWWERVESLYEQADLAGVEAIPRLVGEVDEPERRLLMKCPGQNEELFDVWKWRHLGRAETVRALRKLAGAVQAVHASGWCFGGLNRSDLLLDVQSKRLVVGAVFGLRRLDDDPETLWRDIRVFAELAWENFLEHEYPGGHRLVELLQDREAMAETGITQPGLSQLLAGCVTPFGDLAYEGVEHLIAGLDNLAEEIRTPLQFRVGSRSTQGTHIFRQNNQDSCGHVVVDTVCGSRRVRAGFFCVADGIGGIEDGEHASALAVNTACAAFWRAWRHYDVRQLEAYPAAFARAVAAVTSQRLVLHGDFAEQNNRGGTTFTGLLVAGRRAGICHVGDSRALLVRGSRSIPLTRDHTLAAILDDLNETPGSEDDASHSTISRFLSTGTQLEYHRIDGISETGAEALGLSNTARHTGGFELQSRDLLVLTSDGAHTEMTPARLRRFVALHRDSPRRLCDAIVNEATENIGRDNATALAVYVG